VRRFKAAQHHFKVHVIKLVAEQLGNASVRIALQQRITQVMDDFNQRGNVKLAHSNQIDKAIHCPRSRPRAIQRTAER
jgi:hypothetical protein